jgi:hypothetical protein
MGPQRLSDVGGAGATEQGEGKVAASRHNLGTGASADLASILPQGDIADVMEVVLDAPVRPQASEEPSGIGLRWGDAGDAVADLQMGDARLGARPPSFQAQELPDAGPRTTGAARVPQTSGLPGVGQCTERPTLPAAMHGLGSALGSRR